MTEHADIQSAEEFVRLRTSSVLAEYNRAAHAKASEAVWLDVINRFPLMKEWVAHNKTVPLAVLEVLLNDRDPRVRAAVAHKRKLTPNMFERLAGDADASVRAALSCNAKLPPHLADQLRRPAGS